jgi:hypothetical protein
MAEPDDRALIRQFIARELETINEYERMAALATDPALKRFFEHVVGEEREHVAEGMHELMRHDPAQRSGVDYQVAHALPAAGAPVPLHTPEPGTAASVLRGYVRLTVGGLRSRGSE